MDARKFIEREQESGCIKGKKKLFRSDIIVPLAKYADEYHKDKVKHLCIGDNEKSYLKGAEDTCNDILNWVQGQKTDKEVNKLDYQSLARATKKGIEKRQAVINNLTDIRLYLGSYFRDKVSRKQNNSNFSLAKNTSTPNK